MAGSLSQLGMVAYMQDDYGRAAALLEEALQITRNLGARDVGADALEGLAWVASACGQAHRAAQLGGAADALREVLGVSLKPGERASHVQVVRAVRASLGENAFAAAWAAGRALPLEEAIALALEGHAVVE
jgi:hypothetical protein